MLTKRQQRLALVMREFEQAYSIGAGPWPGVLTHTGRIFRTLCDMGFVGFEYPEKITAYFAQLTPDGERLAAILAVLPAPLTRRQWEILIRFRDVGTDSTCVLQQTFQGLEGVWYLPVKDWDETFFATSTERTMRTLCDYGLIGFEYRPDRYAHLTPLGEELVSLLPPMVRK